MLILKLELAGNGIRPFKLELWSDTAVRLLF